MIDFKKILAHRNRGLLLDLAVFVVQLILIRILATLSVGVYRQAEEDTIAKTYVALFLIGLFFLQPAGPLLKRWSFHQRDKSFEQHESALTRLLLSIYRLLYIGIMLFIAGVSIAYIVEVFPDFREQDEKLFFAIAMMMAVLNGILVFRYFRTPKRAPRWKFLMTPQAEWLGDLCMFLNVICFQILWSVYISSPQFWYQLNKITESHSDFLHSLGGRLLLTIWFALIFYFPPRIFYLVIDQHRKITWLMILLANLPLIIRVVFFSPVAPPQPTFREPSFVVTSEELYREYAADYRAGMRKYLGQYVNVTGHVQTRFFPKEGNPEIGLDGENGYPLVYCEFDEYQTKMAETLDTNQTVTLQCVGSSNWDFRPKFEHCLIVKAQ
jgi:hypothetical protein